MTRTDLDANSSRRLIHRAVDAVTREQHLADVIAVLAVKLSDEEVRQLEAPYIPHPIVGFL